MNITSIEYIKELSCVLNENGLTKIDVSDAGLAVAVEKCHVSAALPAAQKMEYIPAAASVVAASPAVAAAPVSPAAANTGLPSAQESTLKSPIVGVFYSAPSPDAEPFVKIGDTVKKGDIICIIEAMKFLNEITAEQDGTITDICVKNGDLVEFGQILFKIS